MEIKKLPFVLSLLLCLASNDVQAKLKMPALFTDGMVLQQQSDVNIWGASDKTDRTVTVKTSWNGKEYTVKTDKDGKWKTSISTPAYGGPYSITLSDGDALTINDVMIGEVWLCSGQSNMAMFVGGRYGEGIYGNLDAIVTAGNTGIRMFNERVQQTDKELDDCKGRWLSASSETVPEFSATAYFFARKLNQVLNVPVGIINASCGSSRVESWMSGESLETYKGVEDIVKPSVLYNGMLNALVGYGIRGCLWYQGEANVGNPELYARLLPDMVKDWRKRWNRGDFPFLYAQIAPFNYKPKDGKEINSAYLREAQVKCLDMIPNSGMIILSDIGYAKTIHPMNKQEVGQRFAYLSLGKVYGMKGFAVTGPIYKSMKVEGNRAEITFDNTDRGLTTYHKPFSGFEVAGEDKVFRPASAKFGKGSRTVIVWSKDVPRPVAVRYGFRNYFDGCLFNSVGLPASSFRTDNW